MKHPLVSIVMAVYNGQAYLQEAIDSILIQSYSNFEFIIVNDASTDESYSIINSYDDSRIVVISNERNMGLAASLNSGIKIAKGKYIARMDDDDISQPNRLEKQVEYLESNSDVGLLGSYTELIGDRSGCRKHDEDSDSLKVKTLFSCQFSHPTVMIRKSVLDTHKLHYNEAFDSAQDYELWCRMLPYTNFATWPESLLKYRFHDKQISSAKRERQINNTRRIYKELLSRTGIEINDQLLELHQELANQQFNRSVKDLPVISKYFYGLIQANNQTKYFPGDRFNSYLTTYFYNICRATQGNRVFKAAQFAKSGLVKHLSVQFPVIKILLSRA